MLYTPISKREAKAASKPSMLIMMMIMLVSLFAVGCGDSGEDFVVTGNQNNPQNPGTLTFQFAKAQAVQQVPQSTVSIQFDWLNASNGIISTDVEPFATVISLTPPAGTVGVRVTPLTADGFPLFALNGTVSRPANGTNFVVDFATFTDTDISLTSITVTPDPVSLNLGTANPSQQLTVTGNFSNGQNIPFAASALVDVDFTTTGSGFTVSDAGLVSGTAVGTGTVTASYTFTDGGATAPVSDTVTVNVTSGVVSALVVSPDPLEVGIGQTSDPVTATFTPSGGSPEVLPNGDVDYSITATGFTANEDGTVTVADTVAPGTSATLTASYVDGGQTFTDTVTVTANNARLFSQPSGDTLSLPFNGFTYQLAVEFNGAPVENLFASGYTFAVGDTDVATVGSAGLLTTGENGTTTVTLLFQGNEVDEFTLTTDDLAVTNIEVTPANFDLTPGEVQSYSVLATYDDNSTADIAASPQVVAFGSGDTGFYAGRAIGGEQFGNFTYNFTYLPSNVSDSVTVTQAAGFVSSYNVTVGGLAGGNVPLGLQAAVDVNATLSSGEVYRLRPDQFSISEVSDPNNAFEQEGTNIIGPASPDIGDTATWAVQIDSSDFVVTGNATREFNLRVVDNTSGVATASFTHYTNDNVMFEDISRPITVHFSNGAVTNFRVTDEDASTASAASTTNIQTDSDIWGFPCVRAWEAGFNGLLTIDVQAFSDSNSVIAVTTLDVDVWEVVEAPQFIPASIILNPGETREVEVIVLADEFNGNSPARSFSRALEFAYPSFSNDDGLFARRRLNCAVTAYRAGITGEVEARDVCTLVIFDALQVTVTGATVPN